MLNPGPFRVRPWGKFFIRVGVTTSVDAIKILLLSDNIVTLRREQHRGKASGVKLCSNMCARVDYSILARTSPALTWPVLPFMTKDGSVKSMMSSGNGLQGNDSSPEDWFGR